MLNATNSSIIDVKGHLIQCSGTGGLLYDEYDELDPED